MKVYITYDVHNGHDELKNALIEFGFRDAWVSENKTYSLPNTSLWHKDISDLSETERIFFRIKDNLNKERDEKDKIIVERFMAVPASPWSGIEGEPHAK